MCLCAHDNIVFPGAEERKRKAQRERERSAEREREVQGERERGA